MTTTATPAQAQQMARKVAEVRAALEAAESASLKASLGTAAAGALAKTNPFLQLGAWLLPAVLTSDADEAVAGSIRRARKTYEQWADDEGVQGWRRWALRGSEPAGYPYAVSFWLSIGDALLSELTSNQNLVAVSSNLSAAVDSTADLGAKGVQLAKDAKQAAEDAANTLKIPWPLKWKLAAGGAGVVLVGGVAAWLLGNVNTLLGKREAE